MKRLIRQHMKRTKRKLQRNRSTIAAELRTRRRRRICPLLIGGKRKRGAKATGGGHEEITVLCKKTLGRGVAAEGPSDNKTGTGTVEVKKGD